MIPSEIIFDGVSYDLSHLAPFRFKYYLDDEFYLENYDLKARDFVIGVEFSEHCFTINPDATGVYGDYEGQTRTFNPELYEASKLLPNLIANFEEQLKNFGTVRLTNFFYCLIEHQQNQVPYIIYFEVMRSDEEAEDVKLIVRDAFLNESNEPCMPTSMARRIAKAIYPEKVR